MGVRNGRGCSNMKGEVRLRKWNVSGYLQGTYVNNRNEY